MFEERRKLKNVLLLGEIPGEINTLPGIMQLLDQYIDHLALPVDFIQGLF